MLTKKRMALLTVLMTIAYFALALLMPASVVGERSENMLLLAPKLLFLGLSAAITTSMIMVLAFKREFIAAQLASFNRFRHLLRLLVKRDFISKYRKSILGVLWSLLNPLLTMLVMAMVFSYIFRMQIENFPVYMLSGNIIYSFFSESTNQAMGSVIANEGIIKKVYVPKYIFPVSKVLSSLVNLLFSFIAFLLVFIITQASFRWTLLLIPIPIIYAFVFSLGISMLLSSLAVFFRDLSYLYGVLLTLLMYMTPLFYPIEALPESMVTVIGFNPIYHFVNYFRDLALRGAVPGLWENMVCLGFALAALCLGMFTFMSQQDRYILHL
jgi:ABC-type polysaccharide/polyol phosphate export permease